MPAMVGKIAFSKPPQFVTAIKTLTHHSLQVFWKTWNLNVFRFTDFEIIGNAIKSIKQVFFFKAWLGLEYWSGKSVQLQ